jgi:nickel/cobalt exporter
MRDRAVSVRRIAGALAFGGLLAVLVPGVAGAHPLGNFTVNQASALRISPDQVVDDHVVDMAEIPTFQARQDIDRNHDGRRSGSERAAWARSECARVRDAETLTVEGSRTGWDVQSSRVGFLVGQAGLPTLRLTCRLVAPVADDRIGWHEITAVGDRATLVGSRVPTTSPSASLTRYPHDRLSSPLDVRSTRITVRPGGAAAPRAPRIPTATGSVVRGFDDLTQSLTSSVSARKLTVGLGLIAVAIAIGLGALHAFAPGHGKTVMAAYLVGERGTIRDGLLIGVTVASTHTLGVLVLGLALTASQTFAPESVYPYLSLASGVCFVGLGLTLLLGALRRRRVGFLGLHHHHHGPGGHTHEPGHQHSHADVPVHTHEHGDDPSHAHGEHEHEQGHHDHHGHEPPAAPARLSRRSLLTLGFAGGMVPTPTAVVVLLGATAIGRAWFGAILVVAYGIGMGGTLVMAGVVLARARRRFDLRRHSERAFRYAAIFPLVTAIVITASGLWLVARAAVAA